VVNSVKRELNTHPWQTITSRGSWSQARHSPSVRAAFPLYDAHDFASTINQQCSRID